MTEPLIYDLGAPGRCAVQMPEPDVPLTEMPALIVRDELNLPEVSEIDIVRHYTRLSSLNHSIDKGFYPLGSCTMKYNPRINEDMARLPGFAGIHPLQDEETIQGALFLDASLPPGSGRHKANQDPHPRQCARHQPRQHDDERVGGARDTL